jgi:N12 class adenine-specific DNA methylase
MPKSNEFMPSQNPEIPGNLKLAIQHLYEQLAKHPAITLGSPECISGIYFLPIEALETDTDTIQTLLSNLQEQFPEVDFDYAPDEQCITITAPDIENEGKIEIDPIALEAEIGDLLYDRGYAPLTLRTEDGKGITFTMTNSSLDLTTADEIKKIEKKYSNIEIRVVIDEHASSITVIPKIDNFI